MSVIRKILHCLGKETNVCIKIRLYWCVAETASIKFSYRTFCLTVGMLPYVLHSFSAVVVLVEAHRCNDDDDDTDDGKR